MLEDLRRLHVCVDSVADFMELKQMLEKIGQPKTHLECKKMIKEIDKTGSETINYREFLDMMLGSKNSVLRL